MANIKLEESVLCEINLTHKSLDEGVSHLIDWISKQPHLPNITDKILLKAFIVGSKSIERAKERVDKYYTARTKYPIFFLNRDPLQIKWNSLAKTVRLPGITAEGCYVMLSKCLSKTEEINLFDYNETIKHYFMLLERVYKTDPIVSGQYLVIDTEGLTLEGVSKCFTSFTLGSFSVFQGCLPLRLKKLIVFNASSVADIFVNKLFRALFNEKLKERIVVHTEDHSILSKYIPIDMIPSDYGGKAPSIEQIIELNKKDMENNRDWFLKEGVEGSDESKREKSDKSTDQIQGTFRKLQID